MSPNTILLLMFGSLTLFMLTGLPIAFVLGGLSLLFIVTLWEPSAVIVLVLQIFDTMKSESLLAIPLFILMACILQRSGVIEALYKAMEMWFGRLRGGLAIGTVIICVVMAAMTGGSGRCGYRHGHFGATGNAAPRLQAPDRPGHHLRIGHAGHLDSTFRAHHCLCGYGADIDWPDAHRRHHPRPAVGELVHRLPVGGGVDQA
jgi:hypothetical protein